MVCIYCGNSTQVTNSRLQKRTNSVWRRRHCMACGAIFSSIEQADFGTVLSVQYDARTRKPFVRDQLFVSIYESCKHRPQAIEDAEALCRTIIADILAQATNSSIDRNALAKTAHTTLYRFDPVAATMYQAYHPFTH